MSAPSVTERECKVLIALAEVYDYDGNCMYFRQIARRARMPQAQVRRIVRSLARKGFAEYVRGLFDDDGKVAGSGYCATPAGVGFVAAKKGTSE